MLSDDTKAAAERLGATVVEAASTTLDLGRHLIRGAFAAIRSKRAAAQARRRTVPPMPARR